MPNNVKGKNGSHGHSIKQHQNHISEKAADTIKGGETVKTGSSAIKSNHSVQDAINTTVQTAESSVRSSSAEGGTAGSEATLASQTTRDVPDHITNHVSNTENLVDAISDHQDRKAFREQRAVAARNETVVPPTDKALESFKPETSPFATAPDYRTVTSAADNAYQVKVHQTVIHDSIKSHAGNNTPKQPISDLSTITHDVAQREQTIKGAAANAPAVKGLSEGPKLKTSSTQHQVLRGIGNGIKAGTAAAAHSASTVIAGASTLMGEGDESEKIANAEKIMASQGLSDAHNDLHSVTHQATNRIIKNKVQDHFEKKEGIKTGDGHGVKAKEGVPRVHPDVPGKSAEDVTGARPANWVSKARERATAKRETIGNLGKNKKAADNAAKSVSDAAGGTSVVKSKEITGKAANKKAVEKKTAKAGQNWRLRKANTDNAIAARSGEKIKSAEKKKPKKGEPAKKKAKEAVKKKAVDKKTVKKKPAVSGKAKNAIAGPRNALASPEKLLQRKGPGTVKGRPDLVAIKKKTTKSKKALKTGKAARKVNKNAIKKGSSKAATKKAAETAKRKARHAAEKKVLTQVAAAKKAAEAKAAATAAEATAAVASGPVGWVVIAVVAVIMVIIITFIAVFGIFMNKQSAVSGGYFDGQYLDMISGTGTYYAIGGSAKNGFTSANYGKICAMAHQAVVGYNSDADYAAHGYKIDLKNTRFPFGSIVYVEVTNKNGQKYSRFAEVNDACEAATQDWNSVTHGKKGRNTVVDMWLQGKDWPAGRYNVNVYLVQKGNGERDPSCANYTKYMKNHPTAPVGGGTANLASPAYYHSGLPVYNGSGKKTNQKGVNIYNSYGGSHYKWNHSALPNCTSYAWGRCYQAEHVALPNLGNGGEWYSNAPARAKGKKPAKGAIACWTGGYGHVGFVESVNGNKIITTESGHYYWDTYGKPVITKTYTSGHMGGKTLTFIGYIYPWKF